MRTAPAVHVSVTRFGVWRAGVGSALALVSSVLVAWAMAHSRAQGPTAAALAVAGITAAVSAVFAVRLLAVRAFSLRWDGRCWHLSPAPMPGSDAVSGELHAAIDAGNWLLLRFVPERRGGAHWLPVQRRGLEPAWHGLRCAVYSPRAATGEPGAGTGS